MALRDDRVMTCIYLRLGLTCLGSGTWKAPLPEGAFPSSVSLRCADTTLSILNLYFPTGAKHFQWAQSCAGGRWLVVGDFNSRDALLEKGYPTHRDSIAEELESGNLVVLNTGAFTRIPDRDDHAPSALDLSLASDSLVGLSDWQIEDDPMGSDHLPITISISIFPLRESGTPRPRYLFEKADWDCYQNYLNTFLLMLQPPIRSRRFFRFLR